MDTLPAQEPVSRAAAMEARYHDRLPRSLDDLVGPDRGTVQLPLHVAWSGMTVFEVEHAKRCIHMYQLVITEGQREDVTAYISRSLLVTHWPVLRKLLGRVIREVWESAFPELTERRASTA